MSVTSISIYVICLFRERGKQRGKEGFILRNWPTRLYRLGSATICCRQAGGASGLLGVWFRGQRPKSQGNPWCKSQSKGLRRWDEMSQLNSKTGKDGKFLLPPVVVLFRPSTDRIYPLTLGRANCFTGSTDSNVNLIWKHPQRHIQKEYLIRSWVLQSSGHIK